MELFKIDHFKELLELKGLHQITIYSPTSRDSTDNYQKDKINFKNQVQKAESLLGQQYGLSEGEAREYLKPAHDLLDNADFWQHGSDAIAYFQSSTGTQIKSLPLTIEEPMTFVGKSFQLRPLIPLLNADGRFYILNLNLEDVRLYEATTSTFSEVVLDEEVPTKIGDYMKFLEKEEHLQWRSGHGGKAGAMFHGHGVTDTEKEDIQQYFYDLSKAVDDIIQCDPLPTVLAGVEYLIPMYRKASKFNNYAEESINGSFSENDAGKLFDKAWAIMQPAFDAERNNSYERYAELEQGDWAASDTEKVIMAALTGQVETLFVREDAAIWGVFNQQLYELEIFQAPTPETKDLLTEAAVQTLLQGGKVYQCSEEEMPDDGKLIAAIFRNPVTV